MAWYIIYWVLCSTKLKHSLSCMNACCWQCCQRFVSGRNLNDWVELSAQSYFLRFAASNISHSPRSNSWGHDTPTSRCCWLNTYNINKSMYTLNVYTIDFCLWCVLVFGERKRRSHLLDLVQTVTNDSYVQGSKQVYPATVTGVFHKAGVEKVTFMYVCHMKGEHNIIQSYTPEGKTRTSYPFASQGLLYMWLKHFLPSLALVVKQSRTSLSRHTTRFLLKSKLSHVYIR